MARELGKAVAFDRETLATVLPELVTRQGQQLWLFGQGLADGTEDPRWLWDQLVAQLAATPVNSQRIPVVGGFLNSVNAKEPGLANTFLDDAVEDDVLGPWYPGLQTVIGINQEGFHRLMRSLDVRKASIWTYRYLESGGVTHNLSGADFNKLLLRIAAEPDGLEIALNILRMRLLFEGRQQSSPAELVHIGCELMGRISFANRRTDVDVHNLGIIVRSCLLARRAQ